MRDFRSGAYKGATLDELARSYNVGISTICRATSCRVKPALC